MPRESLEDRIYRHLRARLKRHDLKIGEHVNAAQIALNLNVSRTSVRKAILRLIDDGTVKLNAAGRPIVAALPKRRRHQEAPVFAYANQTEQAYWAVFDAIFESRLRHGENVNGLELAETIGVSLGTVRQALDWLCRDGLLQRLPRRGWKVVDLDERDMVDAFKIRMLLEPEAMARALDRLSREPLERIIAENQRVLDEGGKLHEDERRRVDYRFHHTLLEACHSPILMQTVDPLVRKCMLTGVRFAVPYGVVTVTFTEHIRIAEALLERNLGAARSILKDHLMRSMKLYEGLLSEQAAASDGAQD